MDGYNLMPFFKGHDVLLQGVMQFLPSGLLESSLYAHSTPILGADEVELTTGRRKL